MGRGKRMGREGVLVFLFWVWAGFLFYYFFYFFSYSNQLNQNYLNSKLNLNSTLTLKQINQSSSMNATLKVNLGQNFNYL